MDQFEYVIPFIGITYGLSITTLLSNVHRVLSQRPAIKLHPIPPNSDCRMLCTYCEWMVGILSGKSSPRNRQCRKTVYALSDPSGGVFILRDNLASKSSRYGNDLLGHFQSNKRLFLSLNIIYLLLISATLTALKQEFELNQGLISNLTMASVFLLPALFDKYGCTMPSAYCSHY